MPTLAADIFPSSSWVRLQMDECLCYKGALITEDFLNFDRRACTGGEKYVWGFSRLIVVIAMSLEAVWFWVCLTLWIWPNRFSVLVAKKRPATGSLRSILDLSELVRDELRDDNMKTCWDSNRQLEKKISGCPPVGYAITNKGPSHADHVGLVSVMRRRAPKSRVKTGWIKNLEKPSNYGRLYA